jgi:hypothetical protein
VSRDAPRECCQAPPAEQRFFLGARQPFDGEFQAQRVALGAAATVRAERERPAPACVARPAPGVVSRDAQRDIARDARIQRAVLAARDVHEPAFAGGHRGFLAFGAETDPVSREPSFQAAGGAAGKRMAR